MRCVYHSDREAAYVCNHCGKDVCADCAVDVNGNTLCKPCVAALAGRTGHGHGPGPGYDRYHCGYPRHAKGRSKAALFILSFLPGLGYMYLGLIKRGLLVMSAFFLNIYLLAEFSVPLLAFLVPVIFFASFFDGFSILRRINAGEAVTDSIDDIKGFVSRNRRLIFGGLGAVLLISFITNFSRNLHYGGLYAVAYNLLPFILIMCAVMFIFLGFGRRYPGRRYPRRGGDEYNEEENNGPDNNDPIDKR